MAKGVNIPLTISGLRQAREDLKKLDEQFEKVKNDPIKSKKIAKEFNQLSSAIDDTTESLIEMNSAGELAGTKFDDLNEVLFNSKEEILPLTSQIGEMEDRMYQLAASGDTSSKEFKKLQSETIRLRAVIIETDRSIDTMAEGAGNLSGLVSAFGNLGESVMTLNFQQAGKDLKILGSTFKAFGATLLANPIFLIVAIIAAVVTAVVTLRNKVKFLGDIFDFFAGIVNDAIQALKDFADWIGLSDFAEQDAAEKRQKRAEQNLKDIEERSSAEQSAFDRKIALMAAEGKSTVEVEKQKQRAIVETVKQRRKQLLLIAEELRIQGKLTEEKALEIRKLRKDLLKEGLEAINQYKIIEANETKAYKEELGKRKEAHKKYLDDRLAAERLIQDLELELMDEGVAKEILQNEIKYERLREDTLKNVNLTEQEKQKAIAYYNELEQKARFDLEMTTAEGLLPIKQNEVEVFKTAEVQKTEFQTSEASKRIAKSKEERDAMIANIQDYATGAMGAIGSINSLADTLSENRLKNVKEGSKQEEKIRKNMFIRQKAMNLAMAAVDGFKAITASLAQSPIAIGPVPNPAGIASLAFAITSTAASIAGIASQQFEGGGSAPSISNPSASIGGGGSTSTSQSSPSFELFGQPNQDNNVSAVASQETQQMTVKAVVVESDITSKQNKVAKMQKNAEL